MQGRRKESTEFLAVLWTTCHLGLHMEVHAAIVSTPKGGKAVQGDHQSLQIQGAVQEKRTDVQNWLGKSSTVQVFSHSLAQSMRMTVPLSWCLWWVRRNWCQGDFRGHAIRVKWRQSQGMETFALPHCPKSSGTIFFFWFCWIKIIPYKNFVILEFGVGSQTKNHVLGKF